MALVLACFAVAEFIEFVFYLICMLYLLMAAKSCMAVPVKIAKQKQVNDIVRYEYQMHLTCDGSAQEGILVENVRKGKERKILLNQAMQVRFDGKKCYDMSRLRKSILRAFLTMVVSVVGALVLLWLFK